MIFFENLKKKVRLRYLFFIDKVLPIRRDAIFCVLRLPFSWSVEAGFLIM